MIIEVGSEAFLRVQGVSKALFGNQDRLVVAAAVAEAEPGTIFGQSIAEKLGMSDNRVGPQLTRLEVAGLLTRLPKIGGERRVYFERRESAFWDLCVAFCRELTQL